MTRLVVTTDADTDLHEILDYLKREASARVAEDYGRKFALCIERLVASPRIGSPRPALGVDARMGIVWPYLLIYDYTLADDTLTLLRIVHGKRNVTRRLVRGDPARR